MKKNKNNAIFINIANFIMNKKNIFILFFIVVVLGSLFTINSVNIENDLTKYLGDDSMTRAGLEVMNDEFEEFYSANIMVNIDSYEDVLLNLNIVNEIDGVASVIFSEDNYKNNLALFTVVFDVDEENDALYLLKKIKSNFEENDIVIDSSLYDNNNSDEFGNEMRFILILAIVIISLILLFTSKSYAEIPILLTVFAVAALINKGSHFIFSDISFISDSISIILQLALAIDYALIIVHRYTDERNNYDAKNTAIVSLSKSIPEVLSSSLTTICGLVALSFMDYQLGFDLSKVLIKSILISLLCVFTLLPILLYMYDSSIQKTKHKNFVPSIKKIVTLSTKFSKVITPLFLVLMCCAYFYSSNTSYLFNEGVDFNTDSPKDIIEKEFPSTNDLVLLVNKDDSSYNYIEELYKNDNIVSVNAFELVEVINGMTLDTEINYMVMKELLETTKKKSKAIFLAYATSIGEYNLYTENIEDYKISLNELLYFIYSLKSTEAISEDILLSVEYMISQVELLKSNYESENYKRLIISTSLPIEGEEVFSFISDLIKLTDSEFSDYYLVGEQVNAYELSESFKNDRIVVSILSAIFIIIILIFTFKSITISLAMILIIQAAIFMNFSFPYFFDQSIFFVGYLIVVAIQMGANIDYAIVVTNRYKEYEKNHDKNALVNGANSSFTTILTSGSILAIAGFILNKVSSDLVISSLGGCIARGTVISIVLVLIVLPALLELESKIFKKKD